MPENAQDSTPKLPDSVLAYLTKEQKQLRNEIENLIARIEADQKNGLILTGAIWAWFATNVDNLGTQHTREIVWAVCDHAVFLVAVVSPQSYGHHCCRVHPKSGKLFSVARNLWVGTLAGSTEKGEKEGPTRGDNCHFLGCACAC